MQAALAEYLFGVLINYENEKIILLEPHKLLYKLKLKYDLWIISNTSNNNINYIKSKYKFFNLFSGIITSESANSNKPNAKIFKFALKKADTSAYNSIFIDDSIINIKIAEKLGFNVHHYRTYLCFKNFVGH